MTIFIILWPFCVGIGLRGEKKGQKGVLLLIVPDGLPALSLYTQVYGVECCWDNENSALVNRLNTNVTH